MGKQIEVLFLESKKGEFFVGDRRFVAYGYARNFLFPNRYAVPVTADVDVYLKKVQQKITVQKEELKKEADVLHKELNGKQVTVIAAANDGKLYGSVHINDIITELKASLDITLDRSDVKGYIPVKVVGVHTVQVRVHEDVHTSFEVYVKAADSDENETPEIISQTTEETADTPDSDNSSEASADDASEVVAEEAVAVDAG